MGFYEVKTSQERPTQSEGPQDRQSDDRKAAPRSLHALSSRLQETVICVENQHRFGLLYADFLKARKRVFIDQKLWDLPQTSGMEFDQYDTPQSRSVVIHEYGRILAGVRLLPTTARCGCYSYMLRDAQLGLLPDIPNNVLHETAPVMPHVWEATRLFLSKDEPAERRAIIQTKLIRAMAHAAIKEGATHVIGIVPATFQRWMNRIGHSALPIGPKMAISGDHTQAALMHVAAFDRNA